MKKNGLDIFGGDRFFKQCTRCRCMYSGGGRGVYRVESFVRGFVVFTAIAEYSTRDDEIQTAVKDVGSRACCGVLRFFFIAELTVSG